MEFGIDGPGTSTVPSDTHAMKAFVLTGPGRSEIQDVPDPRAGAGQAVVDVARAGICGTDAEFFTGQMEPACGV